MKSAEILRYENKLLTIIQLTIFDLCDHLSNIEQVTYTPSVTGLDYFDILTRVYYGSAGNEKEHYTQVREILNKVLVGLFSDQSKTSTLKSRSVTDLDLALVTNNTGRINSIMEQEEKHYREMDIYEKAKFLRFAKFATEFYKDKFLNGEKITGQLNLALLPYTHVSPESLQNLSATDKTCIISIHDEGQKIWSYEQGIYEYHYTKPLFDVSILFGTGINAVFNESFKGKLIPQLQEVKEKLGGGIFEFAVIRFNFHGAQRDNKLTEYINLIPEDFAKTSLYVLQGCYSGEYHKHWTKKACLITPAGDSETCSPVEYKVEELPGYLGSKAKLEGFIKFYAETYKTATSTPYISGLVNGEQVGMAKVKDYYDSHYPSASSGAGIPLNDASVHQEAQESTVHVIGHT